MSSFYGQIGNITSTHFQFDKIYPNRRAMDLELLNQKDNIFAGRFVLVNYNSEDFFTLPNVQIGYRMVENGEFYQDVNGQIPYVYSDFISFSAQNIDRNAPSASVLNNYYFKKGVYFFKMPAGSEYYSASDYDYYYTPTNTTSSAIVGTEWIIREYYQGRLTGNFYQCVGQVETVPRWSVLNNNNLLVYSYINNYKIDETAYAGRFDTRGYNATIWQKIYSGGTGYFSLVARLECTPPAIELYPDPPSLDPFVPYLDASSTDIAYRLHVPTHWGLQVKKIEEDEEDVYNKSDQVLTRNGTSYNADIYMNLGGSDLATQQTYHLEETHKDIETSNEILIEPTGQSGTLYNGTAQNDILEISIHTPALGNMIDQGYDLIYGANEDGTRPRDIAWYDGRASDTLKEQGASGLNYKTYDLKTLAGNINTMHNILGQIIVERMAYPTAEEIENLSSEYIYRINNQLYRKGTISTPTVIAEDQYKYTAVSVTESEFQTNKYYYLSNTNPRTYREATGWNTALLFAYSDKLYLKNLNNARYTPISLLQFQNGSYYFQEGENYICESTNDALPSSLTRTYYENITTEYRPGPTTAEVYTGEYTAGTFYIEEEDAPGNYIKSYDATPSSEVYYYSISATAVNYGYSVYIYRPNCFFVERADNRGVYVLADEEVAYSHSTGDRYYVIKFSTTPYYRLIDGEIVKYYAVEELNSVSTFYEPANINALYIYDAALNRYIAYNNIEQLGSIDGKNPYTIQRPYYTLSVATYAPGLLYTPGVYYYKNNSGSYIKDYGSLTSGRQYYSITGASMVNSPFYYPNLYWYESATDIYEKDLSATPTPGRQYYTKIPVYVYADRENICPYGYAWNDLSSYIPPSITLCEIATSNGLIPLTESNDHADSLYGLLLYFNQLYDLQNEMNRDTQTIKGIYNSLRDILYQAKTFKPGNILYVNDFGQIESSNITLKQLENLIEN